MKKTLIGILFTCVGLVVLGSVVLEFMDWNQFKPQITEHVEKATGRKLEIGGDLKIRLLPTPKLIVHDLKFTNDNRSKDPYMATAKSLKVGVALIPLLSKHVQVTKVILDTPVIHLEKLKDSGNWVFAPLMAQNAMSQNPPSQRSGDKGTSDLQIQVDKAEITNGEVIYTEGKTVTKITDLHIEMGMKSLKGPFHFDGGFNLEGAPYTLDLKTDKLDDKGTAKVVLTVSQGLADVRFDGSVNYAQKTAKGTISGELKFYEATAFTGQMEASEQQVQLTNLNIQSGAHKGTGDVLVRLEPALSVKANLSGLPGNTFVRVDARPEGDGAQGHGHIHADNLYTLLRSFGSDIAALSRQSKFEYASSFRYSKRRGVDLRNINLKLNGATLRGSLKASEVQKGYFANLDLKTDKLETFLELADVDGDRPFGPASIKGTLKGSGAALDIDQVVTILGGTVAVKGSLSNLMTNLGYTLFVKTHHPNLAHLWGDSSKPAQRIALSSRLKGSLSQVEASQIRLVLGPVRAVGSATYTMGSRHKLTATIEVPQGNLMQVLGGAPTASSAQKPTGNGTASGAGAQETKDPRWSREPFDFGYLQKADMDVKVKAVDISIGKFPVKNATFAIHLNQGNLKASTKAQAAGGRLTSTLTATITDRVKADVDLVAEGVNLQQMGQAFADYKDLHGKGTLRFKGGTQGRTEYDIISNLKGTAQISTQKAVLVGWDMKSLGQSIGSLQGLTRSISFDSLMGQVKDKKKKTRLKMTGTFKVLNGVIRTQDFQLIGDGIQANGRGKVSLPEWMMDSKADVFLTDLDRENSFPGYARGPLDNLSYGLETGQLMQFVYKKFLKGTVEKVLGLKKGENPINKLLGVQSPKAPSPQSGQPPQPAQPAGEVEKAVGSVLKGLFGN